MRFLLLMTPLLFALSACAWSPTFMPAGYSYHHEDYKSPPGKTFKNPAPRSTDSEAPQAAPEPLITPAQPDDVNT